MSDLRAELLEAFREEYREHLDGLRAALAALEAPGAGAGPLEEAGRLAHSLRAAARVCDLDTPAALGGGLEALFSRTARGELAFGPEAASASRQAADAVEAWGRAWEAGQAPAEPTAALQALDRLLGRHTAPEPAGPDDELLKAFEMEYREHLEGIRALLAEAEAGGAGGVDEAFRRAHSLKGCARAVGLRPAEVVAHRLENLFEQVRQGGLRLTPAVVGAVHRGLELIEDATSCLLEGRPVPDLAGQLRAIDALLGGEPAAPAPAAAPVAAVSAPTAAATEAVRVGTEHLDRLLHSAGQLLAEGLGQDQVLRELTLLRGEAGELARQMDAARSEPALRRLTAAPETARLGRLLAHVEEGVRALARRAGQVHRMHRRGADVLRLLGRQLQQDIRRVRVVPAESVFQGFRKMLRDLAVAEGKEVDFRTVGLNVQADRQVLQALKDPLMHVLRNAVGHGIEPPDERRRQGKEPAGRVSLTVAVRGSRLHVTVEDDGRGIDNRAVAEEAVRRRLLTEAEAAAAAPAELARLVFHPGFSTAGAVTDLAGRGMGLSVVEQAAARLHGTAETARPESGRGTCVQIVVPLAVTAQRLLLAAVRGQTFAFPAHSVERLLRAGPGDFEAVGGRPMLLLGGEPVPLQPLARLLGMAGEDEAPRDLQPVVVVRSGPRRLAVAVDETLAATDALIKDLGPPLGRDDRWAGGIVLGDGSVCLVLNPAALFDGGRTAAAPAAAAPAAPRAEKQGKRTILVVDDSLTTRTLEKSILEANGYRVVLALNGLEALARMRDALPDLVITDVQMPHLDGFGLLAEMKKEPRLARLPVIVVTSLEKREDQDAGLALGADAYIVKRKFDHEELLHTVRQIL